MTSRSHFGKMNSTLGSVVPLAMFFCSECSRHHLHKRKKSLALFFWILTSVPCSSTAIFQEFYCLPPLPCLASFAFWFIFKGGTCAFLSVTENHLHETVWVLVRDRLISDLLALPRDNLRWVSPQLKRLLHLAPISACPPQLKRLAPTISGH